MPLNQSITTYLALNAANDTSPSGVTDLVTGQPIYVPDLDLGVYFDLTEAEANQLSYTTNGTLHEGRYRRVQVDSAATAANIKTGTIGLLSSLLNAKALQPNVVTSFDQGMAVGMRPVVFLNPITPGNYGFVQELGCATVLGKSSGCTGSIGDVILAASGDAGAVTDPTQSGNPTWATLKTALGLAVDLPQNSTLFRILLTIPPVLQGYGGKMSQISLNHGYPDNIGRRFAFAGNYTGPKSYTNTSNIATTGDPVTLPGLSQYIDFIDGSESVSGTYLIRFRPSGAGPRATWKAVWVTISTATEVTNATDLSGETVIVGGFGGKF